MTFDYPGRIGRLQELMVEREVEAMLLSVGADLRYLTGYEAMPSERLTVAVVPSSGEVSLFVPGLEAPRVGEGPFLLRPWSEIEDPIALASSAIAQPSKAAVGDHMWSVFLTRFQKEWPHASWVPASQITSELRARKDPVEVGILREAAQAVDRAMRRIPSEVAFTGRTERDVMRSLAEMTVEEGHDSAEFAIVASGENGASPHHHPGKRVIAEGDLVVCDFGGRRAGYFSDSTRTFVVGEPTAAQVDIHAIVLQANEAGRVAVASGVPCQEVDRAVRHVIEESGLGDRFIHRTGHGIGLEVHEHPYLVEGNEDPLEAGMVFSVEPGVYLPGRLGVRIEDIVVCTVDGAESLNDSPRRLVSCA